MNKSSLCNSQVFDFPKWFETKKSENQAKKRSIDPCPSESQDMEAGWAVLGESWQHSAGPKKTAKNHEKWDTKNTSFSSPCTVKHGSSLSSCQLFVGYDHIIIDILDYDMIYLQCRRDIPRTQMTPILKVNPPKQGQTSNQNRCHLGSRYIYVTSYMVAPSSRCVARKTQHFSSRKLPISS